MKSAWNGIGWMLALIALVVTAACSGNPRARLVQTHGGLQTALAAVDDAERVLCFGTTTVPAIANRCSTEAAKTAGLTDERHQAFHRVLNRAYEEQLRLNKVIEAWTPGAKVDTTLIASIAAELTTQLRAMNVKVPDLAALILQADKWRQEVEAWIAILKGGGGTWTLTRSHHLLDSLS